MKNRLVVASKLSHGGDGLVRYTITANSEDFGATTMAWGNAGTVQRLSDALQGFPSAVESSIQFRFGSAGTGTCDINLFSFDRSGHTGVWLTLESAYPATHSERHERADLFFRVEAAAINRFAEALSKFVPERDNQAVLEGRDGSYAI